MLSDQQVQQYHNDGFLLVQNLFPPEELQAVKDEVAQLVDQLARELQAEGRLKNLHEGADFYQRLTLIDQECPGAAVRLHVRGLLTEAIAKLWSSPKLLDIIEQFIGPDISGHPIWNLRCKTPDNALATVPWHQDTAYLLPGAENTLQPTAWIPLLDTNEKNGTLQVVRGAHREGLLTHRIEKEVGYQKSWYLYIPDEKIDQDRVVRVDVPFGSALFINQLIPHRSTENFSEQIRWSLDLRFQNPSLPTGCDAQTTIPLRKGSDPSFFQDWTQLDAINRKDIDGLDQDPDKIEVTGPWLDRWSA